MDSLIRIAEAVAGVAVATGVYAWYQVTFVMVG